MAELWRGRERQNRQTSNSDSQTSAGCPDMRAEQKPEAKDGELRGPDHHPVSSATAGACGLTGGRGGGGGAALTARRVRCGG
ncbi:hypothetical protein MHYP_G00171980 [Metynnis hypsauchen]